MFCKAKSAKIQTFFLRGDSRQISNKHVQIWDHFFPLLFPKDSESLKILDIRLQEVGGKKTFKRYLKSEQTHRHTDWLTFWLIESIGPEGRCFENTFGYKSIYILWYILGWAPTKQNMCLDPIFWGGNVVKVGYKHLLCPWCNVEYLIATRTFLPKKFLSN